MCLRTCFLGPHLYYLFSSEQFFFTLHATAVSQSVQKNISGCFGLHLFCTCYSLFPFQQKSRTQEVYLHSLGKEHQTSHSLTFFTKCCAVCSLYGKAATQGPGGQSNGFRFNPAGFTVHEAAMLLKFYRFSYLSFYPLFFLPVFRHFDFKLMCSLYFISTHTPRHSPRQPMSNLQHHSGRRSLGYFNIK